MNPANPLLAVAFVRRAVLGTLAGLGLVLGLAHCSSNTNSGTGGGAASACQTVCSCVGSHGGDSGQCMTDCNNIAASSHDLKNDCESELKSRGFSTCEDTCKAFNSTTSSGGGGETATLADFCEKCDECVSDPSFSEGFCTPFKTSGGGFDVSKCSASGQRSQLRQPSLTKSALSSLSCAGFDDAE